MTDPCNNKSNFTTVLYVMYNNKSVNIRTVYDTFVVVAGVRPFFSHAAVSSRLII